MKKIGAYVTIATLVTVISSPSPSAAFGLDLGPIHLGLPLSVEHRHQLAHHADIPAGAAIYNSTEPGTASAQAPRSALLYPGLALPAIYGDIFSPAPPSQWPFGYDVIFRTAFAKAPAVGDEHPCQPVVRASAIADRIGREVRPTAAQRPLLQKLGGALGMASGFLAKSCPKEIPAQPVARLQLMETQIEELTMALGIVRQPLQEFEHSLTPAQQARLAPTLPTPTGGALRNKPGNIAPTCEVTSAAIDRSIERLDQSLQPNDKQRDALADIKKAFARAASDLDANCPTSVPPTALARLDAAQARLDAEWRALLTVQVALRNLESGLSADQQLRFDAMDFASR